MRVALGSITGLRALGDGCVPGMIDPVTGDTVVSCGSGSGSGGSATIPTCPLNVPVSGTCLCPAGYSLDPTSLQCTGGIAQIFGMSGSQLYVVGGIVALLLVTVLSMRK